MNAQITDHTHTTDKGIYRQNAIRTKFEPLPATRLTKNNILLSLHLTFTNEIKLVAIFNLLISLIIRGMKEKNTIRFSNRNTHTSNNKEEE